MKLEEYKTALRAIAEFKDYLLSPPGNYYAGLINYCNKKIDELEKPPLKKYRCIKAFVSDNASSIEGIDWSDRHKIAGFHLSELPFHFEEIVHEPAPVTIKDIYDCLDSENPFCENPFTNKSLTALFKRAKQEGNL